MNRPPEDFDTIAADLIGAEYIYAKTMPQFPHHYTVRKKWSGQNSFEDVVQFIRDHGFKQKWGQYNNTYLQINGQKYWTMGAPLPSTILINRDEVIDRRAAYDNIADSYDRLHTDPASLDENRAVINMIGYKQGSLLDIGCGTGLLLDCMTPSSYVGIDPSTRMLSHLKAKHPDVVTVPCSFERFVPGQRFDHAVALFGAASYIPLWAFARLRPMLNAGGQFFLMFYRPGYRPVTYNKTGVSVDHFTYTPNQVLKQIEGVSGAVIQPFGNFTIISGHVL